MRTHHMLLCTLAITAAVAAGAPVLAQAPADRCGPTSLSPVPPRTVDLRRLRSTDTGWVDTVTGRPVDEALIVGRHPNGRRSLQVAVVRGRAEGLWQEWYDTGVPRYLATWCAGRGEGTWLYFHPSGAIRERSVVVNDQFEGPVEGWYASGVKEFEGRYTQSARMGRWRFWRPDGALDRVETYPSLFSTLDRAATAARPLLPVDTVFDALDHWEFGFTPDGRTLVFATGDDTRPRQVMAHRWDGAQWSPAEALPFSRAGRDGGSFISPDGAWLYFSRSDSTASASRDLHRVRIGAMTGPVQRLTRTPRVGEINLALDAQGRGFLWADRGPGGKPGAVVHAVRMRNERLVVSPRPLRLGDGSLRQPNNPFIDPQGRFLLFAATPAGGAGQEELFVSALRDGVPGPPVPLGSAVNTGANEIAPFVSPDGRFLLFASDRPVTGGRPDRYRIFLFPVAAVDALRPWHRP